MRVEIDVRYGNQSKKKETKRPRQEAITWALTIATAWLGALLATISHATSFDCEKATAEVEKTVCSDSELSRLDEAMDQAYSLARTGPGKERVRTTQLRWIAQRNACKEQDCIRNAYLARLEALEAALPAPGKPGGTGAYEWKPSYQRFRLMRGRGKEVCEAYLAMLRGTYFERPPYCDRPEPVDVPGFTPLERVPLDADSVLAISVAEAQFMSGELDLGKYRTTPDRSEVDFAKGFRAYAPEHWPTTFAAPVDVDNDGVADRVAYWPAKMFRCGEEVPFQKDGSRYHAPRHAFALDAQGRLDVLRTREMFGHPIPFVLSIRDKESGAARAKVVKDYRPIARMVTLTQYRDTFYFDGLMDYWGDLENSRRFDMVLFDTFGVYERRDAKTIQQCEIRWIRPR